MSSVVVPTVETHFTARKIEKQNSHTNYIKKRKTSSFYSSTWPLIAVLRLLGKFPYVYDEDGTINLGIFSPWMAYTIILYIITTYVCVTEFPNESKRFGKITNHEAKIFSFTSIMLLSCQLIQPLASIFEWSKLITLYNKWKYLELDIKMKTGIDLKTTFSKYYIVMAILEVPGILLGVAIQYSISWSLLILLYLNIYVTAHVYVFFWVASLVFVSHSSTLLLEHTLKVLQSDSSWLKSSKVSVCRRLWLQISEQTEEFAIAVTPTLLLVVLACGIAIVMSSYALILSIKSSQTSMYTFPLFAYLMSSAVTVIIICDYGYRATRNVGNKFCSELMKIDLTILDDSTKNEMSYFISMIGTHSPELSFCGLITINRSLFVSFCSSTVTYLIVLIQFNESLDSDLDLSTNFTNST